MSIFSKTDIEWSVQRGGCMVRFKVVKGSHLLLGFAIAVFLAAALFVGIGLFSVDSKTAESKTSEAKVVETFASSDLKKEAIKIEVIPDPETSTVSPAASILIYHTHSHEAYEQDEADPYEAVETWRTEDPNHSVVRIGTALAEELREKGFRVVHDMTDHELDDLSTSYVRSLETLEGYKEEFDLYIDLHRDAYSEGMLPCLTSDREYAQLMLLVGRGDKHPEDQRPDYGSNLDFAQRLTSAMNEIQENICRNVTVKSGRYNQHIGTPSILIEFGHNKNTLPQALNSVPIAAQAIEKLLMGHNFI